MRGGRDAGEMGRQELLAAYEELRLQVEAMTAQVRDQALAERTLKLAYEVQQKLAADRELLVNETNHRTKNSFQIAAALLALQAREFGEEAVRDAFARTAGRLEALQRVYETLYRGGGVSRLVDCQSYLTVLCRELTSSERPRARIRIEVNADPKHWPSEQAIPIGMIVNELVTNAMKHAFPASRAGRIEVALRPVAPRQHELSVADDGIGLPRGWEGHSFGMNLVRSLARQLGGELAVGAGPGTRFSVWFQPPA